MRLLRAVGRTWVGLLWLMMASAAGYIGFIMLAIVYMTVFRTAGWDYNQFVFTLIEYGFIYILFLGSPWLVRTRGHVYIEMLTAAVPERRRKVLSRGIAALCALICLVWLWYTLRIFIEHFEDPIAFDELRAERGMRLWTTSIAYPVGFFAMAVEFLRYVFGRETMHSGQAGLGNERAELEATRRSLAEPR